MGGSSTHTYESKLAGIQIQTSLLGVPLPIGWGRSKIGCNLIDYVAFTATPHTTSSSSGGKGFGSSSSSTTYTYTASVVLALCEGPITGIVTVYKDSSTYTGLSAAGLGGVMLGSMTQSPWAYLTSAYPTHALNYHGIAYVYAQDYPLSSGASLSNHSFEVDFGIQVGGGVHDANPKDVLNDFFTNVRYGIPGWGTGLLGDWTDYSNYCLANNLLLSPVLDAQTSASDFVQRILQQTNSDCFWSEGVLKIKSFGDASATGNGVTWNPNLTPVYDLTEDDFLGEVQKEIIDQGNAYNMVQIEYLDRSNLYQVAVVPAYDLDDIVTYGLRKQDPQSFHEICDGTIARHVAQLVLQRQLYIRDLYHFDLPMDFVGLEPMDYVTLTTVVDGMVLNRQLVQIQQIDEDQEGNDVLHFIAEGIPGQTASAALYAAHTAGGYVPVPETDPGSVTGVRLLVAPSILADRKYEAWAAVASNTNPNWGGAHVWISFDNVNYSKVGTITAPGTFGVLTATLASHADPDTVDTLAVDLTSSLGTLTSVTNAEADGGAMQVLVDNEIIYYGTATLTAANKYNLTYLRRGQGSVVASHSIGANFLLLDDGIFKFNYHGHNAGQTIYVKFQSFNVYGRGLQDLAGLTAYTLSLASITTAPSGASVTPEYRSNIIRWTNPTSLEFEYVQILASMTNNVATATVVGKDVAGDWTHQNLNGGDTWYYWLNAVDFAGNVSTTISAGSGTALTIALYEGIGSDSVLTPAEKLLIIREWNDLQNEKAGIDSSATSLGITTEKTNYDNAYSTLSTYLSGLSPAYNDTTQNTSIVRTTWDANWESLYTNRQALLNKIDAVASTLSNWSGVKNDNGGLPDSGATKGDNHQVDPSFDDASNVNTGGYGKAWSSGSIIRTAIP